MMELSGVEIMCHVNLKRLVGKLLGLQVVAEISTFSKLLISVTVVGHKNIWFAKKNP